MQTEETGKKRNTCILHLDLDTFFVSVERLFDPGLNGKALIVGGYGDRGVVSSCSYEARKFGVRSAMPVWQARRLCPEAIVISGNMERYTEYSAWVTDIIQSKAPLCEKASVDEFYIDLTGMDRFFGCYEWATELRQSIQNETGLPVSFGLSVNKMISKIATDMAKPAGQLWVKPGTEQAFLDPLPVCRIPMVGEKMTEILHKMGIHQVKTLRETPRSHLERIFGKSGYDLWRRAHGRDDSEVIPFSERKSISTETTFDKDISDRYFFHSLLRGMTEKLAFQLRAENRQTACVTVRIRYSDFSTFSRQMRVSCSNADTVLSKKAVELFEALYEPGRLVRLVGVRFSDLVSGGQQTSLLEDTESQLNLLQAVDKMKNRFGTSVLFRANSRCNE